MVSKSSLFSGLTFAVSFPSEYGFKQKKALKNSIIEHGGRVSYVVSRKCSYLLADEDEFCVKTDRAIDLCIRIVPLCFVEECIERNHVLPIDAFASTADTSKQTRLDVIEPQAIHDAPTKPLLSARAFEKHAVSEDRFNQTAFSVMKWIRFKDQSKSSKQHVKHIVYEIHETRSSPRTFRLSEYTALQDLQNTEVTGRSQRHFYTSNQHECAQILESIARSADLERTYDYVPLCGSGTLIQILSSRLQKTDVSVDKATVELVDSLWSDALAKLLQHVTDEDVRTDGMEFLQYVMFGLANKIDDLESSLLAFNATPSDKAYEKARSACKTLKLDFQRDTGTSELLELCQVIRDLSGMCEETMYSQRRPGAVKYAALNAHIEPIAETDMFPLEFLISVASSGQRIHQVYKVSRMCEAATFDPSVGNTEMMFHGSKSHLALGIILRGLLMPEKTVSKYGVIRSDVGHLGSALYFTPEFSSAAAYTSQGAVSGHRFAFVCEVALGHVFDTDCHLPELMTAPAGFHSVHGSQPEFKDEQYAVYSTNQQRLAYIIEFSELSDTRVEKPAIDQDLTKFGQMYDSDSESIDSFNPLCASDFDDLIDSSDSDDDDDDDEIESDLKNEKRTFGLSSTDAKQNDKLNLEAMHIRGKIVDLASEVTILQVYRNSSAEPLEARYTFPLSSGASTLAVCGFEAFIAGRHVKGVVKPKEKARKEYKEAVRKGHGAYLMEEDDRSEVYVVNIGNLPPRCSAVIKITYVAEIATVDDQLVFELPTCITSWEQKKSSLDKTQDVTKTICSGGPAKTSLMLSVEMPYKIRRLSSWNHRIITKTTDVKATVRLCANEVLGANSKPFQLYIDLAEIHVPRIWIEENEKNDDAACMLVFYPEFATGGMSTLNHTCELYIALDLSNSIIFSAGEDADLSMLSMFKHTINTLKTCLAKQDVIFNVNVAVFGTEIRELYPSVQKLTPAVLDAVKAFLLKNPPTMGSTDTSSMLNHLGQIGHTNTRNVLLMTDGHSTDRNAAFASARHNKQLRIFGLAFGLSPALHSMRALCFSTGGACEAVPMECTPETRRDCIQRFVGRFLQPSVSDITMEWQHVLVENVQQAPQVVTSLFAGERLVIYAFVPSNCSGGTLHAKVGDQHFSTLLVASATHRSNGDMLRKLAARALIAQWEFGSSLAESNVQHTTIRERSRKSIMQMSIDNSIMCSLTSFIAVDERKPADVLRDDRTCAQELLKQLDEECDDLGYIGWSAEDDPRPTVHLEQIFSKAQVAETFSRMDAQRKYEELMSFVEIHHMQEHECDAECTKNGETCLIERAIDQAKLFVESDSEPAAAIVFETPRLSNHTEEFERQLHSSNSIRIADHSDAFIAQLKAQVETNLSDGFIEKLEAKLPHTLKYRRSLLSGEYSGFVQNCSGTGDFDDTDDLDFDCFIAAPPPVMSQESSGSYTTEPVLNERSKKQACSMEPLVELASWPATVRRDTGWRRSSSTVQRPVRKLRKSDVQLCSSRLSDQEDNICEEDSEAERSGSDIMENDNASMLCSELSMTRPQFRHRSFVQKCSGSVRRSNLHGMQFRNLENSFNEDGEEYSDAESDDENCDAAWCDVEKEKEEESGDTEEEMEEKNVENEIQADVDIVVEEGVNEAEESVNDELQLQQNLSSASAMLDELVGPHCTSTTLHSARLSSNISKKRRSTSFVKNCSSSVGQGRLTRLQKGTIMDHRSHRSGGLYSEHNDFLDDGLALSSQSVVPPPAPVDSSKPENAIVRPSESLCSLQSYPPQFHSYTSGVCAASPLALPSATSAVMKVGRTQGSRQRRRGSLSCVASLPDTGETGGMVDDTGETVGMVDDTGETVGMVDDTGGKDEWFTKKCSIAIEKSGRGGSALEPGGGGVPLTGSTMHRYAVGSSTPTEEQCRQFESSGYAAPSSGLFGYSAMPGSFAPSGGSFESASYGGFGSFGSAPSGSGGLFGNSTSTAAFAGSGGLFGNSTSTAAFAGSGGLFGNSTSTTAFAGFGASGGLFGSASTARYTEPPAPLFDVTIAQKVDCLELLTIAERGSLPEMIEFTTKIFKAQPLIDLLKARGILSLDPRIATRLIALILSLSILAESNSDLVLLRDFCRKTANQYSWVWYTCEMGRSIEDAFKSMKLPTSFAVLAV